ncbi:MAG: PilZ domain-containing protein [Deltaproteobacteria bacterium]|nr:PilZ domain-containing protein [Deltaproteobacteria bacterium]
MSTAKSRRTHARFPCDLPLRVEHEGREISMRARNISLGGMLCVTDDVLAYGVKVMVHMVLPALGGGTSCLMVVRWHKDGDVGLQFGSLRAKQVWALNQYFVSLDKPEED